VVLQAVAAAVRAIWRESAYRRQRRTGRHGRQQQPAGTSSLDPKLVMAAARPRASLGRLVWTVVVISVL
jgi:hypothetical protein